MKLEDITPLQTPYLLLSIFSRNNSRRGQWSTKGILERVTKYVPIDNTELKGLILYVKCPDRPTLDKICRSIDTYAGTRVNRSIEVIK